VYIDCSQVKTKLKLVRRIATEFGVDSKGRYSDMYDNLVYYLRSIDKPLIVLDGSRGFAIRGVFGAESPVERHRAKLRLVHDGSGRLEGKDKPLDRV